MAKIIFQGLEDSGKSYQLARKAEEILKRNAQWFKVTGIPRPIVSNLEFTPKFEAQAESAGIPIKYWKNLDELVHMNNCDLFIDEVGTYFDSRSFKDLPLDVRLWIAQASKMGVDMYGSTQDFMQIDLAFRRLVNELWHVRKLIGSRRPAKTRPGSKRVWGICTIRQIDPQGYDEQKMQFSVISFLPSPFFLRKKYCEYFDTTKRIALSAPPAMKHIARRCEAGCNLARTQLIDGVTYHVTHV